MERDLLIQEEVDNLDKDDQTPDSNYMLRKRPRLSYTKGASKKSPYVYKRPYRRKNPIMHLPTEILYKIFSFLTNEELGSSYY